MTRPLIDGVESTARVRGPAAGPWWRTFRNIGDVAVYYVDLAPSAGHEADAVALLDEEERSRWQGYGNPDPRRRFALCRAALRAVLCGHLNVPNDRLGFATAKRGKPFAKVDGKPVSAGFNVSHSGEHGLIAVAPDGQVGVDIEVRSPRRTLENLIKGVLSAQEQVELARLDEGQKLFVFYRLWTIKEALVKAHGMGLALDVAELEIPADMLHGAPRSVCEFWQFPNATWSLGEIGTDEFAAAVAFRVDLPS